MNIEYFKNKKYSDIKNLEELHWLRDNSYANPSDYYKIKILLNNYENNTYFDNFSINCEKDIFDYFRLIVSESEKIKMINSFKYTNLFKSYHEKVKEINNKFKPNRNLDLFFGKNIIRSFPEFMKSSDINAAIQSKVEKISRRRNIKISKNRIVIEGSMFYAEHGEYEKALEFIRKYRTIDEDFFIYNYSIDFALKIGSDFKDDFQLFLKFYDQRNQALDHACVVRVCLKIYKYIKNQKYLDIAHQAFLEHIAKVKNFENLIKDKKYYEIVSFVWTTPILLMFYLDAIGRI